MSGVTQRSFPHRLFFWFIRQQVIVAAISLVLLDVLILFWLEGRGLGSDVTKVGRQVVLISLLSAALVLVGVSVFMARRLMGPLGRLIAKTEKIRLFPFEEEGAGLISLEYDEPGEWYDLERALNELGRALREKTIRLSREKTELRAIMAAMNETVLAVNRDMRILFFNPQTALTLFPPGVRLEETTLSELVRSPEIIEAYRSCLNSGEVQQLEARLESVGAAPTLGANAASLERDAQSGSGRLGLHAHYFRVSLAPLRKKHNQEIYGVVGVFHDITDIKRAEQVRIDFVGNVSHELRTPLTSVKGYLETAVHDIRAGHTEQSLEFLGIVTRNVDRLQSLVNDLLDLSSLQGGVELRRTRVDLAQLTAAVLNQVDHRGHVVQTEVEASSYFGDEGRLEQLLRNLVQNAIRYVPSGGHVRIRWLKTAKGGVDLEVTDNGPGIAPEHLSRIFERFYRVDEARSRLVGGTGIGLSLVKHIVQRHGGQVEARSELGKGAQFICHLP